MGLSRVVKNLNDRASSGRKDAFCSPGHGVGKERRKEKPDESLMFLSSMHFSFSDHVNFGVELIAQF